MEKEKAKRYFIFIKFRRNPEIYWKDCPIFWTIEFWDRNDNVAPSIFTDDLAKLEKCEAKWYWADTYNPNEE